MERMASGSFLFRALLDQLDLKCPKSIVLLPRVKFFNVGDDDDRKRFVCRMSFRKNIVWTTTPRLDFVKATEDASVLMIQEIIKKEASSHKYKKETI